MPRDMGVSSEVVAVTGIDAPTPIGVSGGAYSITKAGTTALGSFTTAAGTVRPGDKVTLQQTSSAAGSTTTTATLTVGGVSGSYSITTRP